MATSRINKQSKNISEPHLILWLFAIAAIFLVPWTLWLPHSLPLAHLDRRWGIVWSGLDVGEFISLALTAYLGLRKSGWVIVSSSIAGTLLIIDAWFDSVTANVGWEYLGSLSSAIFVEIPLAFIAFWVAYRVGRKFF